MKKICLAVFFFGVFSFVYGTDKKEISSPDGNIRVTIEAKENLFYSISYQDKALLCPSIINMILGNGSDISGKIDFKKTTTRSNNSVIISPVPEKRKNIPDIYNELIIRFKQPFSLIVRVYNDGIAYRILSHTKDSIIIKQEMVNFYFRIAEACARHQIMIMYHGAFKPAGFNRTYPNSVTREGVLGSEYNIWSEKATPEHNVLIPFIRMTSGPMDYEPGILDNATAKTFRPIGDKVMALGTRCHQAAMFIVYESPIQIFSGNPSQGLLEPAFMELLGSIPTTWDTTIVLDGKVGDYIVTARKKGTGWFIGAMSDWTSRELTIDLAFLDEGSYEATICEDGINADRHASDYKLSNRQITRTEMLQIKMAPGGGYLLKLQKKNNY